MRKREPSHDMFQVRIIGIISSRRLRTRGHKVKHISFFFNNCCIVRVERCCTSTSATDDLSYKIRPGRWPYQGVHLGGQSRPSPDGDLPQTDRGGVHQCRVGEGAEANGEEEVETGSRMVGADRGQGQPGRDGPEGPGGPETEVGNNLQNPGEYSSYLSTFVNLAPIRDAITTKAVEIKIMMIPSAESLPQRPSSAKRRIWTARTSVPGRERTTERLSSRTNIVAIRIQPETIPGIKSGMTIRRIV
jgi:hypothetical protein